MACDKWDMRLTEHRKKAARVHSLTTAMVLFGFYVGQENYMMKEPGHSVKPPSSHLPR